MTAAGVRLRWLVGAPEAAWRDTLSEPERDRHAAMRSGSAAAGFLAARWLLRNLLSDVVPSVAPSGWQFVEGPNGKPECASGLPPVQFNVAHTRGLVVAAASLDAPVGVDVEDTRRVVSHDRLVERYFAPAERAWLSSLDADERRRRFFDVWVLKEAAIKLRGGTLGASIGRVVVLPGDGPAGLWPDPAEGVTFRHWHVGSGVVALAVAADAVAVDAGPWSRVADESP